MEGEPPLALRSEYPFFSGGITVCGSLRFTLDWYRFSDLGMTENPKEAHATNTALKNGSGSLQYSASMKADLGVLHIAALRGQSPIVINRSP